MLLIAASHAQSSAPELILTNGKIVTVDDRFNVAQAVAITRGRIVAGREKQDIAKLAGPQPARSTCAADREFRG